MSDRQIARVTSFFFITCTVLLVLWYIVPIVVLSAIQIWTDRPSGLPDYLTFFFALFGEFVLFFMVFSFCVMFYKMVYKKMLEIIRKESDKEW